MNDLQKLSTFNLKLSTLFLCLACTPSFESPSEVKDLRVLAIRGEPPEALVDPAQGVPEDVSVSALIVDPHAREPFVVQGRVCFPSDSRCGDSGLVLQTQTWAQIPDNKPLYDLKPLELGALPALVAGARADDRLKGFGGIRVQFELTVADGDPRGPVRASKMLLYSLDRPGYARNHNPAIGSLALTRDGAPIASVVPGETLRLAQGVPVGVRPVLVPGKGATQAIEEYDAVDFSGRVVHLRETPRYAFFATSGIELDRETADEPIAALEPPRNGLVRITAQRPGSGTFWVVVRDGRGGEAWLWVSVSAS